MLTWLALLTSFASMRAAAEWQLRPSRQQRRLNALLLAVFSLFMFAIGPPDWAICTTLIVLMVMALPGPDIQRLGVDDRGWWIEQQQQRQYVQWRTGSVRKRHYVSLRWSWRPTDNLVLRADSLNSADDFRRLKARLYECW
jgi:hypothetical protein